MAFVDTENLVSGETSVSMVLFPEVVFVDRLRRLNDVTGFMVVNPSKNGAFELSSAANVAGRRLEMSLGCLRLTILIL